MPPRVTIAAIIAFWLGMTAWLIEREVVPMMLAEDSPTYQVSLTDEIGAPFVNWIVLRDGKRAGSGTSRIHALDDRTYEFRSIFNFDGLDLLGIVSVQTLESTYRVTDKGRLEALSAKFAFGFAGEKAKRLKGPPHKSIEIKGVVANGELPLRFLVDGEELFARKINMREQGNIVNPMHPVSRLRGLRHGQTWKITLFNPLRNATETFIPGIAGQSLTIPALVAEVKSDSFQWNNKQVVCYKIEYYEPGKEEPGKEEIVARTWVRKLDGLVLQQEASYFGFDLAMQRVPE